MAKVTPDERTDFLKRFGFALAKMRDAARLTQADVAERLGVDVQTVSRWENGKYPPDAFQVAEMVAMFEPPEEAALLLFRPPRLPVHDLDQLLAERAARATQQKEGRAQRPLAKRTGVPLRADERRQRRARSA